MLNDATDGTATHVSVTENVQISADISAVEKQGFEYGQRDSSMSDLTVSI